MPGTNFLGNTDNKALELKVNGQRALRLEPNANGPNVIGGSPANTATGGGGAFIGGGGTQLAPNTVTGEHGTVAGGVGNSAGFRAAVAGGETNTASGSNSTVGGGISNTASGAESTVGGGLRNNASGFGAMVGSGQDNEAGQDNSVVGGGETTRLWSQFRRRRRQLEHRSGRRRGGPRRPAEQRRRRRSSAAGFRAKANNSGTFVWADGMSADFSSTANDQFLVRAAGGAKIVRGGTVFTAGANSALQAENNQTTGEGGWFRVGSASNPTPVVSLVKQSTGTGFFLKCFNQSGATFTGKCHISAAGTYVAGSDFAESLPARGGKDRYQPGDVLSISRTHAGQVLKSHKPFDPALIGVYSTRPAVLGADKGGITRVGKQEIPVAITGIVPVKATAQNGQSAQATCSRPRAAWVGRCRRARTRASAPCSASRSASSPAARERSGCWSCRDSSELPHRSSYVIAFLQDGHSVETEKGGGRKGAHVEPAPRGGRATARARRSGPRLRPGQAAALHREHPEHDREDAQAQAGLLRARREARIHSAAQADIRDQRSGLLVDGGRLPRLLEPRRLSQRPPRGCATLEGGAAHKRSARCSQKGFHRCKILRRSLRGAQVFLSVRLS